MTQSTEYTSPGTATPAAQAVEPRKSGAEESAEKAKAAANDARNEIRSSAEKVTETVTSEAAAYAKSAKSTTADEISDVASALRTAADELRSGSPQARTFSQIADGLADASEALRDRDLGETVSDVNNFARRNPLAFLGGAALVGFAATRFAKASSGTSANSGPGYGAATDARRAGMNAHPTQPPAQPAATAGEKV
ncbi:hypothetical protein [Amaricoccus tamworthensis]|uniref:hypothetical protein n=1 Tax=Amaricoccus tamworthensis TaxID=57002 RepID=UPI003C7BC62B